MSEKIFCGKNCRKKSLGEKLAENCLDPFFLHKSLKISNTTTVPLTLSDRVVQVGFVRFVRAKIFFTKKFFSAKNLCFGQHDFLAGPVVLVIYIGKSQKIIFYKTGLIRKNYRVSQVKAICATSPNVKKLKDTFG